MRCAWLPDSNTLPEPKTKMTSAFWIVARRCATTITVLRPASRSMAC